MPPSEIHRQIAQPTPRTAPIEMPQSWNDHSDDRTLDVGAGLIEDEEIEPLAFGEIHAGARLLARVETPELRAKVRSDASSAARRQIGMVLQPKWRDAVVLPFVARWPLIPRTHEANGEKLIELGHRAQHRNPRIEMRAAAERDEFIPVFLPVRDGDEARNPEVR